MLDLTGAIHAPGLVSEFRVCLFACRSRHGGGWDDLVVARGVRRFPARAFRIHSHHSASGQRIEFRAEAFNLLNRVGPGVAQGVNGFGAAGNPNTVFTNTLFGRITTAADPRILQFAIKYVF